MSPGFKSEHLTVRVDIYWSPDAVAGAALAVVDVLRTINLLSAMRSPRAPAPTSWRWYTSPAHVLPRSLPRSAGFRGLADLLVVPGWLAQSGPRLDQLVRESVASAERVLRVRQAGGRVAGV